MTIKEVEDEYNRLLSDLDFMRLELSLREPNIFKALNLAHHEIRHSNFIAWLLSPKETHGLGDLFLRRFIQDILVNDRFDGISIIRLPTLNLGSAIVRREFSNIDILIEIEDLVITVENKLWSKEHSDQLRRYREAVEQLYPEWHRAFVFLTPEGTFASDNNSYINYGYERIVSILSDLLNVFGKSLSVNTSLYIHDYISLIKLNVLENSPANELARTIYKNHKALLDFIEQSKPDFNQRVTNILVKKLSEEGWKAGSLNKGYVRFLTDSLHSIIPRGTNNYWPLKEAFSFEIYFLGKNGKARIYCTITPGNEPIRALLGPILSRLDPTKSNAGQKFWTFGGFSAKFDVQALEFSDDSTIADAIEKFWPQVKTFVAEYEAEILTKKDELILLN